MPELKMKLIDVPAFKASVNLRYSRNENAKPESELKGMEFGNQKTEF
jgi:hypothetical protein